MRTIALVNQKGGCGKTTTAVNLSSFLAELGQRVLLVDMDPQGHCALGFGVHPESVINSTHEVLTTRIAIREAIRPIHANLDAVFSNVVLSGFEQLMAGEPDREYRLRQILTTVQSDYDVIILDSPPSVGLLTFNTLMACTEAVVPVDSSANSIHGLHRLVDSLEFIRSHSGHHIRYRILPVNISPRTNFGQWVLETLRDTYPENCLDSVITTSTRYREAARRGRPVTQYGQQGRAWKEYRDLAREILLQVSAPARPDPRKWQNTSAAASVSPEMKRVVLSLEAPDTIPVKVAGDFNDWTPEDLVPSHSEGRTVWKKVITIPPGTYQYKYVVDGRWIPDPFNNRVSEDIYGGYNSILSV